MKNRVIRCVAAGVITAVLITGCAGRQPAGLGMPEGEENQESESSTGFVKAEPGSYDSADTPVIVSINHPEATITFYHIPTGRNYTLSYDGTTTIYDKYGEAVSLEQIQEGDIVDVKFLKSKKKLADLRLSEAGWSRPEVTEFEVNQDKKSIMTGSEVYRFTEDVILLSEGQQIEWMDIHESDVLTLNGIDSTVYSVVVDRGHGYLKLKNEDYFIGGWIEIGQSLIQPVTEDMLLTVPEGVYDVLITHKGGGGTKQVVINRDEETELDVGDLKGEDIQKGTVLFSVVPASASVYIDGEKADISRPVELEYGIHQLIARADGYKTVTSYMKVGKAAAGIDITLDAVDTNTEEKDAEDNAPEESPDDADQSETITGTDNREEDQDSGKTDEDKTPDQAEDQDADKTSGSTHTDTVVSDSYQVYIDEPEGVEVYLDNNYMGIAPVNFEKTAGFHVVTLRKTGFVTRSYTIQVDKEDKDITYSFDSLEIRHTTDAEDSE